MSPRLACVGVALLILGACDDTQDEAEASSGRRSGVLPGDTVVEPGDSARPHEPVGGCQIVIRADRPQLPADGIAATSLTLFATDDAGSPLPDGTELGLVASSGRLDLGRPVARGMGAGTLTASTWAGEVGFSAPGCEVSEAEPIGFTPLAGVSAQLHLHGSLSEGSGTMREFTADAAAAGLDLMWWTDHDFIFREHAALDLELLDFEGGSASGEVPGTLATGAIPWAMLNGGGTLTDATLSVIEEAAAEGNYGARFEFGEVGGSGTQSQAWSISVRVIQQQRSTLAGLQLAFRIRQNVRVDSGRLVVAARLSEGQGGGRVIYFHDGPAPGSPPSDELWVPMDTRPGEWVEVVADVSALADATWPEHAGDLSTSMFEVMVSGKAGASGSWDIDNVEFRQALRGAELLEAQRDFLAVLASAGGPAQLVGHEITLLRDGHLNAYGSRVPLPDYPTWGGGLAEAVAAAQSHGGLVGLNHLFGVPRTVASEATRAELRETVLNNLLAERVYGCDLLEVGYRERVGDLSDHLSVWDGLALGGVIVTGIGSSDLHDRGGWNVAPNNFVTWVSAASLDEADLLWGLQRGAAWFGDPSLFPDGEVRVDFESPSHRATAGQVIVGETGPVSLRFAADWLDVGWTVRLVQDGLVIAELPVEAVGPLDTNFTVEPAGLGFARVEVVADDEYPVLYTNPIYFSPNADDVAPERLPRP